MQEGGRAEEGKEMEGKTAQNAKVPKK